MKNHCTDHLFWRIPLKGHSGTTMKVPSQFLQRCSATSTERPLYLTAVVLLYISPCNPLNMEHILMLRPWRGALIQPHNRTCVFLKVDNYRRQRACFTCQGGYRSLISYVQCDFCTNEPDSQMCCLRIFPLHKIKAVERDMIWDVQDSRTSGNYLDSADSTGLHIYIYKIYIYMSNVQLSHTVPPCSSCQMQVANDEMRDDQ